MDPKLAVHGAPVEFFKTDLRHYVYDVCAYHECEDTDQVHFTATIAEACALASALNAGLVTQEAADGGCISFTAFSLVDTNTFPGSKLPVLRRRLGFRHNVH